MARKSKKPKLDDLVGIDDPKASLDGAALLAGAKPVLKALEEDLLERASGSAAVTAALSKRHAAEREQERTAEDFSEWQRSFVTQVSAAWFLSCVFVRTLEDRGLLNATRIAGPGASDSQKLFFEMAPSLTERDYLLTIFRELCGFPAARALFDEKHNPVWLLAPSAEAAKGLLRLFRTPDAEAPAFRFGGSDTRFLGDLYQDLSEEVRKKYALLQTPRFVERFILDQTLEPAIEKFGLDETTLIDPTCGSGHFLLGAFERLFDHRLEKEPGIDVRVAARKALDVVYGADINPYAVAIARMRLTLAFLEKAGLTKISAAPQLPLHLVAADSLLHNPHHVQGEFQNLAGQSAERWGGEMYALEDEAAARSVLHRRYAAVVGNPPYIVPKDEARRQAYRAAYVSASMQYSLSAPFCERFFQLARDAGCIGMITANSFMKREFGRKLIEQFLPTVNLTAVLNTSGAFIPGHGTPTVLLFGTAEPPTKERLRAALASRGEPSTPQDPEKGEVWRSISDHWHDEHFENEYISVCELDRVTLARHPWALSGGGASDLKRLLEERAETTLGEIVELIGFGAVTREDDVFVITKGSGSRWGLSSDAVLPYGYGEVIRDWGVSHEADIVFPYHVGGTLDAVHLGRYFEVLWRYRTQLWLRQGKGFKTKKEAGGEFYEYSMFYPDRHFIPLRIAFAFVATHNHFVLDRGGKVFNRSAPIIKLPETATEGDHLALLAYLNSSTACFWMKQVFQPKSSEANADHPDPERNRYEHAGTGLAPLPIPHGLLGNTKIVQLACEALRVAALQQSCLSLQRVLRIVEKGAPISDLAADWKEFDRQREKLVGLQEEIDWHVYELFNLCAGATASVDLEQLSCPRGARPFEQVIPRRSFLRKNNEPIPLSRAEAAPAGCLTEELKPIWKARESLIRSDKRIRMLEQAFYKRIFRDTDANLDEFTYRVRVDVERLRRWLLDRFESSLRDDASPKRARVLLSSVSPSSHASIAEALGIDSLEQSIVLLMNDAAVPFLAAFTYRSTGLGKHDQWTATWEVQRQEDSDPHQPIPIPPKYERADFQTDVFWQLRGKLDVPKERFISYPGCESDEDGEPIYGWAGWNHLQRAQVLAALYQHRKNEEGWGADRLTPILAGILELIPWVKQWHNEPSEEFGGLALGDYFESFVNGECKGHGLTLKDLISWRPPKKKSSTKRGRANITNGATKRDVDADQPSPPKRKRALRKPRKAAEADAN